MLNASGMRAVLAAAATVSLIGSAAQAATYTNVTFSGASGGDFATAGNWNPVRVPGTPDGVADSFDNAVITGTIVNLASDLAGNTDLAGLSLNNATLNVNSGGYIYQDYALGWDKGWLRTSNNSTVNINNGGTITAYGANLNGGVMNIPTGGTFIARGHFQEFQGGAQLNIDGGLFAGLANPAYFGMNAAGTTVNLTDGVLRNGRGLFLRNATLNIEDGSVYATGLTIGDNVNYNTSKVVQTGGDVYLSSWNNGSLTIGAAGEGLYEISGGTIGMSRLDDAGVLLGHGDGFRDLKIGGATKSGRFRIIGNDAVIDIATSSGGTGTRFMLNPTGIIEWVVDDNTVSTIDVFGTAVKQTASLAGVIDMTLADGYTPALGTTYDLLTASHTILDAGYSLDPGDVGTWSLALIGTPGSGQTLQATYAVPEPASFGLLGLAAAGLLRRRTRRFPT